MRKFIIAAAAVFALMTTSACNAENPVLAPESVVSAAEESKPESSASGSAASSSENEASSSEITASSSEKSESTASSSSAAESFSESLGSAVGSESLAASSTSSKPAGSKPVESKPVESAHVHDFSKCPATCIYPSYCECGYTDGKLGGHEYMDGVCWFCGEKDPNYKSDTSASGHVHDFSYRLATCVSPAYCKCGANNGKLDKNFHESITNGICDSCGVVADPDAAKAATAHVHDFSYRPADCRSPAYCSCGADNGKLGDHDFVTCYVDNKYIQCLHCDLILDGNGDRIEFVYHEASDSGFDLTLAHELYGYTKSDVGAIFRERGYDCITAGSGSTIVEKVTNANGKVTYRFNGINREPENGQTHWYDPHGEIPDSTLYYYYNYIISTPLVSWRNMTGVRIGDAYAIINHKPVELEYTYIYYTDEEYDRIFNNH